MADTFGEQLSFCEPYWYQGHPSPFYHDGHKRYRALVRKFVEEELMPNADKWIQEGYPVSLNKRAFDAGITGIIYPKKYGGYMPDDFDAFYELIMLDEINRIGGGNILFQHQINSMALPPIINGGSEELKRRVVIPTIKGDKNCCLAISEPYAGSDVAGIRCTAKKEGDHYIVNGQKKWITGGMTADFFTTLVRTGGEGHGGLSVLLIDRHTPGVQVRKMETQFDNAHSTTMVTLNNVKVPATHLIGREGQGFKIITTNFNHERFVWPSGRAGRPACATSTLSSGPCSGRPSGSDWWTTRSSGTSCQRWPGRSRMCTTPSSVLPTPSRRAFPTT
eukprot:Sspe_Gene.14271::Locus_4930_Transcript_1_1_Confidence_1.000_Length_1478::g.14271::m.14271